MKKIDLINDSKLGLERIMFNGEILELKKYYVNIENLMFNPLNTRVKDKVYTEYPDLKIDDEIVFSSEVQDVVYSALKLDHNKSINKRLVRKLESGQTEALIITETGLIISGNNRFSLIKSQINENDKIKENFTHIIVAVVEGNLTPKEIIEWEISTQKETDIKLNYEEMNLIMRIKEMNDEGTSINKMMEIMSINDESSIYEYIKIAELYETFLQYAGVPNKLDLHRTIPVYSYLAALMQQLNKNNTKSDEKKILPRLYFDAILGSEIPVIKFRDLVNKVVGNVNIELQERVKLLTFLHQKVSKQLVPVIEEIKKEGYTEEAVKKRKTLSDGEFENFFNSVADKVNNEVEFKKIQKKSNAKTVINKVLKINDVYETIIDILPRTITYEYTENETEDLRKSLEENKKLIEEILRSL